MFTIRYYNKEELCTDIFVNEENKEIQIRNYTDDPLSRAFGINNAPTWCDYEKFIQGRVFPENRQHLKLELKRLGLDEYNPLEICKATDGRNLKDSQWMEFVYEHKQEVNLDEDCERD